MTLYARQLNVLVLFKWWIVVSLVSSKWTIKLVIFIDNYLI